MAKRSANAPTRIRKSFHIKDLKAVRPLKQAQKRLFDIWHQDPEKSLFLHGSAGTGKTFCALYLALKDVLSKDTPYDKILIVRSTVPTRDVGFLPGDFDEKIGVYEEPYFSICDELFPFKKSYDNMKLSGLIQFTSTSFLRGTTFDNTIILVDESQNLLFREINTIITRIGTNSKIVFCGDDRQCDFDSRKEYSGFNKLKTILAKLPSFDSVEFLPDHIVRSGIVKEWIQAMENYE